jgi:hypothetical protein
MQQADRGLKELLFGERCGPGTASGSTRFATKLNNLLPTLAQIVARAKDAGQLRPDVSVTDLAVAQFMLDGVGIFTASIEPDLWRRQLAILLDGLRPHRADLTPLPSAPLSYEQLESLCMPTNVSEVHRHRRG